MYTNLIIEWLKNSYVNNSDMSIVIYTTYPYTSTIFSDKIHVGGSHFEYTIPPNYYFDTTVDGFHTTISSGGSLLNGDSAFSDFTINSLSISKSITGISSIVSYNYASILYTDGILYTDNTCFIDRTEDIDGTDCIMFWDSSDISDVSNTQNIEYIYSDEPRLEYGIYPRQNSGVLRILRLNPLVSNVTHGVVHIDTSGYEVYPDSDMTVYLDYSTGTDGTYLGVIGVPLFGSGIIQHSFSVPRSLMDLISDSSFSNTTLLLKNISTYTATWYIYDSYMSFYKLNDASSLDTSNNCAIYESNFPILLHTIETQNYANVKGGKTFIIDYYTPGNWWNINKNDAAYSYTTWNSLETILSYFGRFYNSAYMYNNQMPKIYTFKYTCNISNPYLSIDENISDTYTDNSFITDSSTFMGIALTKNYQLSLFGPVISPEFTQDDGTMYRIIPYISDTTVIVKYQYFNNGVYTDVTSLEKYHPFTVPKSFYLSFYGKRKK